MVAVVRFLANGLHGRVARLLGKATVPISDDGLAWIGRTTSSLAAENTDLLLSRSGFGYWCAAAVAVERIRGSLWIKGKLLVCWGAKARPGLLLGSPAWCRFAARRGCCCCCPDLQEGRRGCRLQVLQVEGQPQGADLD